MYLQKLFKEFLGTSILAYGIIFAISKYYPPLTLFTILSILRGG